MTRDYKKIKAWQLSNELALAIYQTTENFPKSEIWGMISQMRRATVSVPANIVEGSVRRHKNEYIQFLYIAMSSLSELSYYIKFSEDVEYINHEKFKELNLKHENTAKILEGLIRYIEKS
ncbi:MAG: four helix bundle protein [Candidatus Omnitrophica bacterium]|nr:four helix bundle protein [Candidatus Omnitrophota bacterium]MBU1047066.1 four helix bundle protein [Candidatus Omnitrophota bacterium]MBU1630549.1 four helix bundle protein [Candidatus Omnitrophota bacterium]MBU1767413.1 four helix bundle protein [Candidatus Omnitrophota bacterium]MBU1888733.1 four helix bundle protein [Candidatus Omnitrophota bacterium]